MRRQGRLLSKAHAPELGVLPAMRAGVEELASSPRSAPSGNSRRRHKSVAEGNESCRCMEGAAGRILATLKWEKPSPLQTKREVSSAGAEELAEPASQMGFVQRTAEDRWPKRQFGVHQEVAGKGFIFSLSKSREEP